MNKKRAYTEELGRELSRRFADRNIPGYWGVNARAWLNKHIAAIRAGNPNGYTGSKENS